MFPFIGKNIVGMRVKVILRVMNEVVQSSVGLTCYYSPDPQHL